MILRELMHLESPPASLTCVKCCQNDGSYICQDCTCKRFLCGTCCAAEHIYLSFHRLRKWNGCHYEAVDLGEIGHVVFLGHNGDRCPAIGDISFKHIPVVEEYDIEWEEDEDADIEVVAGPNGQTISYGTPITAVTVAGVFPRTVQWCRCQNAPERWVQLLRHSFFPASFDKPATIFTFDVLDHFTHDLLECKTSAMNFYNKIKRITNNAFPSQVPVSSLIYSLLFIKLNRDKDRYRELMRVGRQWRNLDALKRAGMIYTPEKERKAGDLAIFCPACPQPGINIPPPSEWKEEDK